MNFWHLQINPKGIEGNGRVIPKSSHLPEGGYYTVNLDQVKKFYQTNSDDGAYNISYIKGVLNKGVLKYLTDTYKLPAYQPDQIQKPHVLIID